ncbi:hypothetical protein SEVIR_2G329151v4 [Setaria viridis]
MGCARGMRRGPKNARHATPRDMISGGTNHAAANQRTRGSSCATRVPREPGLWHRRRARCRRRGGGGHGRRLVGSWGSESRMPRLTAALLQVYADQKWWVEVAAWRQVQEEFG